MPLILSLLSPALLILAAADEPKGDHARIQGKWQAVAITADGMEVPDAAVKAAMAVFTDKTMETHETGAPRSDSAYTLDPAAKPRAVDISPLDGPFKGTKFRSIYELDGDDLKLCVPGKPTNDRPTAFKSERGSKQVLIVLKRVK